MNEVRTLRRFAFGASLAIAVVCALSVWDNIVPTVAWRLYAAGAIDLDTVYRLYDGHLTSPLSWFPTLAAALTFIAWLHRARMNVSVTAEAPRLIRSGWIAGMWIIPIVNLFLPGLFVARVAEVSTADPAQRPSRSGLLRLVWAWWTCWAVVYAFSVATSGALRLSVDTSAIGWPIFLAFDVLYIIAGVLATVVMFKVTNAQVALFTARLPQPDPTHFPTFTVDQLEDGAPLHRAEPHDLGGSWNGIAR